VGGGCRVVQLEVAVAWEVDACVEEVKTRTGSGGKRRMYDVLPPHSC